MRLFAIFTVNDNASDLKAQSRIVFFGLTPIFRPNRSPSGLLLVTRWYRDVNLAVSHISCWCKWGMASEIHVVHLIPPYDPSFQVYGKLDWLCTPPSPEWFWKRETIILICGRNTCTNSHRPFRGNFFYHVIIGYSIIMTLNDTMPLNAPQGHQGH